MRIGKLTSQELQKYVFDKTMAKNPEILQSAGLAEDCAALRTPKILLLTTDPITATGNNAGRLAITVSANDVAVSGGTPLCCLLTIIAPTTASAEDVGKFMKEAHETAEALGVDIVGGHTEFSEAVNRMVVSCTMLGTTRRIVKSSGAKAGDSIVMTKSAAIEATAIMANDHADKLLKNGLTTEELVEAREYIAKVSVVEDAKIVWKHNVSCMHDVTEGGVFGAVTELAEASGLGAMIYVDQIPVTHLTAKICKILDVSPMRLIGSGSILIVTPDPEKVVKSLRNNGVDATVIGTMRSKKEVTAIGVGKSERLKSAPDELLLIK